MCIHLSLSFVTDVYILFFLLTSILGKTVDWEAEYVKERMLRVYSHGSPPIASVISSPSSNSKNANGDKKNSDASTGDNMYPCPVLSSFGLPHDMVYGYAQPYDPIVRFLSGDGDPLYPLVDDLGKDEVTLYSSGPPRSLRPLARALFTAWDGWPEFRDNWKSTKQNYRSVGVQHILLPEPLRYLNDRFVSTNVGVPPTEAIVRISSEELLPALEEVFPLDVFSISLVPQAVRRYVVSTYLLLVSRMFYLSTQLTAKRLWPSLC